MRDVFLLLSNIMCDLFVKEHEYLMRECEKSVKTQTPVNIKTLNFN